MASTPQQNLQNTFHPILHAASKQYHWQGTGALSLKTFRNGRAFYRTGHGHYAVEQGCYLLLNRDQEYSISIDSETTVESFCVFFPDGMIEEVQRSCVTSDDLLLDDPFAPQTASLAFVEKTYHQDQLLAPALNQLYAQYSEKLGDSVWLEEQLHDIGQRLLQVHRQVYREMQKLPAQRPRRERSCINGFASATISSVPILTKPFRSCRSQMPPVCPPIIFCEATR